MRASTATPLARNRSAPPRSGRSITNRAWVSLPPACRSSCAAAWAVPPVPVELVDGILHTVVGLRDRCRRKGIGFDDVGAGPGVLIVDILDRLGLAEDQQVVVALLVAGAADKSVAAEMVFVEAEPLDLGAHGAVEDKDALAHGRAKRGEYLGAIGRGCHRPEEFID